MLTRNAVRLSQILPWRTPKQLTQALNLSSWYPSVEPGWLPPPAGIYRSKQKAWEKEPIKEAVQSNIELWVQLRCYDGNGRSVEDFLQMIELLGQTSIREKFNVSQWDMISLEMYGRRFVIEMPKSTGKVWIVDIESFRKHLLKKGHML